MQDDLSKPPLRRYLSVYFAQFSRRVETSKGGGEKEWLNNSYSKYSVPGVEYMYLYVFVC